MLRSVSASRTLRTSLGRSETLLTRRFGTSPKEKAMEERLKKAFESVTVCDVTDVSGGCGSFFKVKIVSPKFEGMSLVQRNRLVYSALQEEIGEMHGLNVECKTKE